jgi:hypothetical protein
MLMATAAFLTILVGAMSSSSLVSADACTAQLSYSIPSTYNNSNVQMVVPVSATCSFITGQLYVVGNAYDQSLNTNLGSVNTALIPTGGNIFSGQLTFNLPSYVQGHTVQVTISIYSNGPNGGILTTAAQTVQVPNATYSYPTNYYYPSNCYYPGNYCYYPGYYYPSPPSYPPEPPHHHHEPYPPGPPHHHEPCHDHRCRR